VGFCPLQAVSLLSKVSTVAFSGSVAGALTTRSLLIRGKNIAIQTHSKWYRSTVRRSAAIASITPLWIGRIENIRAQQEALEDVSVAEAAGEMLSPDAQQKRSS
jgi:hypothetical protein